MLLFCSYYVSDGYGILHVMYCYVQPNGHAVDNHGLVTIRMKPDPQGRFGFNVKVRAKQQDMHLDILLLSPRTHFSLVSID